MKSAIFMINKYIYNQPYEVLQERILMWLQSECVLGAQSVPDSRETLNEYGSCGISKIKLSWSFMESFPLNSGVGASNIGVAVTHVSGLIVILVHK
jgi:hypothetical protein